MDSRWEEHTISPAAVGLAELEWDTLRCLMEGNGIEFFPQNWEDAIPQLLERELVAPTSTHPLNGAEGPRIVEGAQEATEEILGRPAYYVTTLGHTVLAQVGTFRFRVTASEARWKGWAMLGLAVVGGGAIAGVVAVVILALMGVWP